MTNSKLRELEPGVYVDDELGSMHIFMMQFLNARGFPDTQANRDAVIDMTKCKLPIGARSAEAEPRPEPQRRCRKCGCTDGNCGQCIARTGDTYWWVEQDLCSACADQDAIDRFWNSSQAPRP